MPSNQCVNSDTDLWMQNINTHSKGATPVCLHGHVCLPVSVDESKPLTCTELARPVCVSPSDNPCPNTDGKVYDPFKPGRGWQKHHNNLIFHLAYIMNILCQIRQKPSDKFHKIVVGCNDGHGYAKQTQVRTRKYKE